MRQAQARGLRIACNPSPMEARVLELPLETVDLFLLNRVEAAQLAETEARTRTRCCALCAPGSRVRPWC